MFSDGMVLQRGQRVSVFGTGPEGAQVEVQIGAVRAVCTVQDGKWLAVLPPMEAADSVTMTARCEGQTLCVKDAACGEVWIAGGQSNMEFWLRNEAERDTVIPAADDPLLRFFDMPRISYAGQETDVSYAQYGKWRKFLPQDAGWFSAVGAYFGLALRQALGVPVAVIGCNFGGTSASCWMDEKELDAVPELAFYRKRYEKTLQTLDLDWYEKAFKARQAFGQSPRMQEFDSRVARGEVTPQELKERLAQLTDEQRALFLLPEGPMAPTRPCALYHFMVERLAPYTAKGVIWYQGESDEVLPEAYAVLFSQLVRCWRRTWGLELPFLTVQLAPFGSWFGNTGEKFPELRRQQELAAQEIPGVWMASIMDAGMVEDIHPKRKRIPGERLALLARGKVYGEQELLCEAPAPKRALREGAALRLIFANAGDGLTCQAERPAGLELLADGEAVPYQAKVRGAELTMYAPELESAALIEVRYAQEPFVQADLYNSAGLCAKPFHIHMEAGKPQKGKL